MIVQDLQTEVSKMLAENEAQSKQNAGLQCPKCERTFPREQGLRMHLIRAHSGKNWDTSRNFRHKRMGRKLKYPSDSAAYRRAKYLKNKSKFLKAQARAQKLQQSNGIAPEPVTDHMTQAARAIIVAAQVLRSVSVGMKL